MDHSAPVGAAGSSGDESPVENAVGPREGRPKRRSFTVEYKRAMVEKYDRAPHGRKGMILRRERLYDSHIQEWRAAAAAGTLEHPVKRGRPKGTTRARSPEQSRIAVLERENTSLQAQLREKDEVIAKRDDALEVLGKGVAFLEALSSRSAR